MKTPLGLTLICLAFNFFEAGGILHYESACGAPKQGFGLVQLTPGQFDPGLGK